MKRFLLMMLFGTGCATTSQLTLNGVRDQFVVEGRSRNVIVRPEAITLVFVDELPGMAAGRCFYNQSPRRVEISRAFWTDSFYSDDTRRQVVYHELGHCLLGILEHVPNYAVNVYEPMFSKSRQTYVSIMEKEPIPYNYYHGFEAEWLDRLFGRDLLAAHHD